MNDYLNNLNNIVPCQTVIYFKGKSLAQNGATEASNTAYQMYLDGKVDLTQRRVVIGNQYGHDIVEFEYLATGRREPPPQKEIEARNIYDHFLVKGDKKNFRYG